MFYCVVDNFSKSSLPVHVDRIPILLTSIFLFSSTAGTEGKVRIETQDLVEAHQFTHKQKEEIEESDKLSTGYESMTAMSHILSEVIIRMWYPVADPGFPEEGPQTRSYLLFTY